MSLPSFPVTHRDGVGRKRLATQEGRTMATGVVKMFNTERGFGFIKPDDGGPDVFLHISALEQAGIGSLPVGARISFDEVMDQRKGKTNAQNVKLL